MSGELTLKPISEMDDAIKIGDEYVPSVRTFGSLGYSHKRICQLLNLKGKEKAAMLVRLSIPGDVYHEAYSNGMALGEYNIDAALAKQAEKGDSEAVKILEERKRERVVIDLRKQLFGV